MALGLHFGLKLARIASALTVLLGWGVADAAPRAVLELFTSQGCPSCPPADALLGEYASGGEVLALSFSVDYWDYLGWADTLASRDNTRRQRDYAAARGDLQVYTPQMIVNGVEHVIGSDRSAIARAIARRPEAEALPVPVELALAEDSLSLSAGGAVGDMANRAILWLIVFHSERHVSVARGANGGQTLAYRNVVQKIQRVAVWKGKPMTIDLPQSEMRSSRADGVAVLLQTETASGRPGRILGAAMLGPQFPGTEQNTLRR